MAKHGLFAVVAATVLCTGVMAATMASSLSPEARWNDLSVSFRKYHSDHTNIFFHLITTPLGVLSVFSLFNKATNTTIFTKALAVLYCLSIMDKMPLHILATTSFVGTGIAMAAANTAFLSYPIHFAVRCLLSKACRFDDVWSSDHAFLFRCSSSATSDRTPLTSSPASPRKSVYLFFPGLSVSILAILSV
jgi:hypothetical protein